MPVHVLYGSVYLRKIALSGTKRCHSAPAMSWVPARSSTSRRATASVTAVFSRARAACPSSAPGLTVPQPVQVGVRAHVPGRECLPAPGRRGAVNTGLRVRPLSSLGRPGWHRRPSGSSPARSPPARRRHGGPWAVYPSPSPRSGAWRGPGLRCVRRESPPQGRRSRPASSGRPGVHSRCWLSRCPTAPQCIADLAIDGCGRRTCPPEPGRRSGRPRCGTHLPRTTGSLRIYSQGRSLLVVGQATQRWGESAEECQADPVTNTPPRAHLR